MKTSLKYYGGEAITDSKIISEIKEIEENGSNDDESEILKIAGEIECIFPDKIEYIHLNDMVGYGGDGAVFKTNISDMVAKIYFPKMRTKVREEKLTLMVNNQIENQSICWPKGLLKYDGSFVGIVMPYIDNKVYETVNIDFGKKDLADFFKNDRRNLLKTLINVTKILEVLRENNIVLCDFNFYSFMINKKTFDVKLIDLDGTQIDKYPCVTCSTLFNAPELFKGLTDSEADEEHIANSYYHQVYSTFSRDNYSLAAYLFMMLMCVKPYNNLVCLANNDFGYHLTNNKYTEETKAKDYSYRWAHLPYFIRELFHKCFTTENPNERLSAKQWKVVLKYYYSLLCNGELKKKDSDCFVLYEHKEIDYSVLEKYKLILKSSDN